MPVDIRSFIIAKDPKELVFKFLRNNSQNAFTVEEIYDAIDELKGLDIPKQKIDDTLDYLIRSGNIEVAFLKNDAYYALRQTK